MPSIWRMWWHYLNSRRHWQSGPYDPATKNAHGLSSGTAPLLSIYNVFTQRKFLTLGISIFLWFHPHAQGSVNGLWPSYIMWSLKCFSRNLVNPLCLCVSCIWHNHKANATWITTSYTVSSRSSWIPLDHICHDLSFLDDWIGQNVFPCDAFPICYPGVYHFSGNIVSD